MTNHNHTFASAPYPLPFLAAAVALGGPAVASAAQYWDIEKYDDCIAVGYGQGLDDDEWEAYKARCCWASGGDWNTNTSGLPGSCRRRGRGHHLGPGVPPEALAPTLDLAPPPPSVRDLGLSPRRSYQRRLTRLTVKLLTSLERTASNATTHRPWFADLLAPTPARCVIRGNRRLWR